MAARGIVRSSKFRHVFGSQVKNEDCYWDLKVTGSAHDSNKVYGNSAFVAVIWEAHGGGSFGVVPRERTGKVPPDFPLYSGHKSAVLDLSFSPFNDFVIASSSDDATAKVWQIPEGGLKEICRNPAQNLIGHKRKVGTIDYHPTADGVLATSSADYTVKIWDVSAGKAVTDVVGHKDLIQSFAWDWNGSRFATTSKDKQTRIFDPRSGSEAAAFTAHQGVKGSRVLWLGERNQLFTCGSSRMAQRQIAVWDPRDTSKALFNQDIDSASGLLIPFYDNDTSLIFLGGKGDGNIRYYEVSDGKKLVHYVNDFKSSQPTLGLGSVPKYALDIAGCEVVRLLKGVRNGVVPVSFTVPRKSDLFQDDIFPDTAGPEAPMSASDFFGGKNAEPIKINLEKGFVPKAKPQELKVEKVEEKKPLTPAELKEENEKLTKRVAYLEAELRKRDPSFSG